MSVYGILVSYYPAYAHESLKKFQRILAQLDAGYTLIIACSQNSPLRSATNSIVYSNQHWEFSGWQEALNLLKDQHELSEKDLIVFANDTFCLHRYFGAIDEQAFIKGFRKLLKRDSPAIAGDLCFSTEAISLPQLSGNYWISTYLFALAYGTLATMDSLHYSDNEVSKIITKIDENKIEFCNDVNEDFAHYINKWLFPTTGKSGWPKAFDSGLDIKRGKIKAILNEKRLSLQLYKNHVEFIPIYNGFYQQYRLWRERAIKSKTLCTQLLKPSHGRCQ